MKTIETVLSNMIENGMDRNDALDNLMKWIKIDGMFTVAQNHSALINNSSEDFSLGFMSIWNNEMAQNRSIYF